jgi:hypothetical protein
LLAVPALLDTSLGFVRLELVCYIPEDLHLNVEIIGKAIGKTESILGSSFCS